MLVKQKFLFLISPKTSSLLFKYIKAGLDLFQKLKLLKFKSLIYFKDAVSAYVQTDKKRRKVHYSQSHYNKFMPFFLSKKDTGSSSMIINVK